MIGLGQDFKLAARNLMRRPTFTFVAVASLALALGANVAIFGVIDAVLFRPFAVHAPGTLVQVHHRADDGSLENPSHLDYLDYRAESPSLSGLASHSRFTFSAVVQGRSERTSGELVSWNYFTVLGVAPAVGRGFVSTEDDTRAPVAVVSHTFSVRAFDSPTRAVGGTIEVNGHTLTVVGVMPEAFSGVEVGVRHDLWIPYSMVDDLWPREAEFQRRRDGSGGDLVGRLAPGSSVEAAESTLGTVASRLAAFGGESESARDVVIVRFGENRLRDPGSSNSYFAVLAGVVGLVFLIAGLNVAALQVVELQNRSIELEVRAALGASRARMTRLLWVENVLLYAGALVGGLGIARVSSRVLESLTLLPIPLPSLDVRLDYRVVGFAFGVAVLASVLFSVPPALRASGSRGIGRAHLSGAPRGGRVARGGLLVTQLTLAATLLSGSALLGRTLVKAYAVDPGYRLDDVLFLSVDLQGVGFRYDEPRTRAFYGAVLGDVLALPGVDNAAWSADIPFERMTIRTLFVPEELDVSAEPDWLTADADIVTPGYLKTMGVPLLQGRDFLPTDDEDAPGVVIVNEAMARRYWPFESPLGKRIRVWGRIGTRHTHYEIVGVAGDVRYRALFEPPGPYIYYPLAQRFFQNMNLHVHAPGEGAALGLLPAVRGVVAALDDDLPVFDARLLSEERSVSLARQRTTATLFALSGFLALVVTALGTYSTIADAVSRRRREAGLRVAVGASRDDILRMFLRETMPLVAVGLVLGACGSVTASRVVESLLLGVSRFDLPSYLTSSVVLAVASGMACYVPARLAAGLDPARTLRDDS